MELNNDGSVEEFDSKIFSPKNVAETIEELVLAINGTKKMQYIGDEVMNIVSSIVVSECFPYMLEHVYECKKSKGNLRPIKKDE